MITQCLTASIFFDSHVFFQGIYLLWAYVTLLLLCVLTCLLNLQGFCMAEYHGDRLVSTSLISHNNLKQAS